MSGGGVEVVEEQRGGGAEEIDPSLSAAPPLLRSSAPPRLCSSASSVTIAGIPVANLTESETVAEIDRLIADQGPHYAAVVNAAKIVAANQDERLKQILLDADLVTADGMSVVWASRVLGHPLKQRVTGIDLFERLIARAAGRGLSVYFLGAREESVRGVVEHFTKEYPSLKISGYHNGYLTDSENHSLVESIRLSRADLLFVAMGSPAQEYWIASNIENAGVRFALGVGGSFDHVSGLARRAPRWMQRIGFEWLYRFLREPRRMWRRYLIGNSVFIWLIARQRLSNSRGDTAALR
jgi:N-acetylglucosaminyldiphosphoundecaprenol N-acetyl-beta-D-mannosaminyltransferase